MKVLITGATGFCARHLLARLRKDKKYKIFGTDRIGQPAGFDRFINADITDAREISEIVLSVKPDLVFHLAGVTFGSESLCYQVNVMGTVNLLDAIREKASNARTLLVGSAAEYGKLSEGNMPVSEVHPCVPAGAYGISKYAATLIGLNYQRNFNLKVTVARPFNILGAGVPATLVVGAILERAVKALKKGESAVKVGNIESERDFIAVEDCVEAYVRLIEGEYWGEVFNICTGKALKIKYVLELLLSNSSRIIQLETDPSLLRSVDVSAIYGNPRKLEELTGFRPKIPIEAALRSAWKYQMERS